VTSLKNRNAFTKDKTVRPRRKHTILQKTLLWTFNLTSQPYGLPKIMSIIILHHLPK